MADQKNIRLRPDLTNSKILVSGTSTLHNWEAQLKNFELDLELTEEEGQIVKVKDIYFNGNVNSFKAEDDSLVTNMLLAMDGKSHKTISFKLKKINSINYEKKTYFINMQGLLNVKGIEKEINLDISGQYSDEGQKDELTFLCEKNLNMTDFEIEPPTMLLGLLKTNEVVTIFLKVKMLPKNS